MSRITKIELEQQIQAQAKELQDLRTRISILQGENELLKAKTSKAALTTSANGDESRIRTYTNRAGVLMGKYRIGHNTFAHRPIQGENHV